MKNDRYSSNAEFRFLIVVKYSYIRQLLVYLLCSNGVFR